MWKDPCGYADYFGFRTVVFQGDFSDGYGIIARNGSEMKLPHFSSLKNFEKLTKRDEEVFAEASELAVLRLEQCIADLGISTPAMNDENRPRGLQPLKNVTNLF